VPVESRQNIPRFAGQREGDLTKNRAEWRGLLVRMPVEKVAEPVEPGALGVLPLIGLGGGLIAGAGFIDGGLGLPKFPPAAQRMEWFRAYFHNNIQAVRPTIGRFILSVSSLSAARSEKK
jgi:hypothetical protein